MHGNPTRSSALDGVAVSMDHSIGHGLSGLFSALSSEESETETPSFTNAAASLRLAGVMSLSVPISSSFPQRPQFESSFCHRSYSAFVTSGCLAVPCARAGRHTTAPATIAPIRITTDDTAITLRRL